MQEDDEKFAKIEAIHPTVQVNSSLTKSDGQIKEVQAGVKAKPDAGSQNLNFEINEESDPGQIESSDNKKIESNLIDEIFESLESLDQKNTSIQKDDLESQIQEKSNEIDEIIKFDEKEAEMKAENTDMTEPNSEKSELVSDSMSFIAEFTGKVEKLEKELKISPISELEGILPLALKNNNFQAFLKFRREKIFRESISFDQEISKSNLI